MFKKFFLYINVIVIFFIFISCSNLSTSDSKRYVQASLDSTFLNIHDDFVSMTNTPLEELKNDYIEFINGEVKFVSDYFLFSNLNDEVTTKLASLLSDIYEYSRYVVHDAEKVSENKFLVKVEVYPLDVMTTTLSYMPAFENLFNEDYKDIDISSMSDDEYDKFYLDYDINRSLAILNLLEANIDDISHLEPKTFDIEVSLSEDGEYILSDNFYIINESIIQY